MNGSNGSNGSTSGEGGKNRMVETRVSGLPGGLLGLALVFTLGLLGRPADSLAQAPAAKADRPDKTLLGPGGPVAAVPAPPGPPPELDAFMKPFDGSWRCESRFFANALHPGSPELAVKSTVRFRKDLDGHFWRGEYEVKKSKTNPALKSIFYVGYDPGRSRFVLTGVDNAGGFGSGVGPAEGEGVTVAVTFVGEQSSGGQTIKTRETMGLTAPRESFHRMEVDLGAGYVPFGEDTCKR